MSDLLAREPERIALSNGIRCLLRPQAQSDIVAVQVFLDITVFDEPQNHRGLANLVQRALRRGTSKRGARELAEALESLGASLSTSMSDDYALVSMQTTSEDLDKALALMAEVMWDPAFAPDEVARERDQIIAEMRLQDDQPFQHTYRHFRRTLFGNHPYGMLSDGTPDSVSMLNTGLCRQWHRRVFTPDNCLLVAVGNFDLKGFAKVLDKHFGKRKGEAPEQPEDRLRPLTTYRPRRTTLHRDVEQAMCIVGWPAPSIERMDDVAALKVVASIMGGGMSSRFFQILRDKMGLAYSVGCSYPLRRSTAHFFAHIGTHPMQSAMATRGIVQMMQYLGREPVPEEELQRAKTYLKGIHLIDHQTNGRQAWHLGWGELVGLGATFDAQWPALIDAVTAEQVSDIVKRHITTPTMVTLRPHPPKREFPEEHAQPGNMRE